MTNDQNREEQARNLALDLHEGQWYDKDRGIPYSQHVDDAVAVLRRFGYEDEDLIAAEYLHDAVEDSERRAATLQMIIIDIGQDVADLVWAVTDGLGKNRRERHEASFEKMNAHPRAILVKLGDRIANVEAGKKMGKRGLVKMYRKEYPEFHRRLYRPGHADEMWAHLEELLA